MKKILLVIGIIFLVLFAGGYFAMRSIAVNPNEIVIREPDLSVADDGVYTGTCETTLVKAKVRVTVEDHKIAAIEILEHECGKGAPAESIVGDVLNKGALNVDTVSGATLSSKVILKAIENAVSGDRD